jgi:hypothetical protein
VTTSELVERKALDSVRLHARNRAEEELCSDCLDHRCTSDKRCKTFERLSDSYAWEILADSAELN